MLLSETEFSAISPPDPRDEYGRRADQRRASANLLATRYHCILRVRKAVLMAIVALLWLGEGERLLPLLLSLPIALFVVAVVMKNRAYRGREWALGALDFYEQRLANLEGRWVGRGQQGNRFLDDQHPCARDLDLFGPGSLFERLHLAGTPLGQETLAAWLRTPAGIEEVRGRQRAVAELRDRLDLREDIALLGQQVPARWQTADLAAWASAGSPQSGIRGIRLLTAGCAALTAFTLAGCLLGHGSVPFLAALALTSGIALGLRGRVRRCLPPVSVGSAELRPLTIILGRLSGESFVSPLLCRLQALLVMARSIGRLVRMIEALPFGPLSFPLLGTAQIALGLEAWRNQHGTAVANGLGALGAVEALNALAAYAYENPADPFPELVENGPCFEAEGLGHPLLPAVGCVRNDVRLDGQQMLLIVSGSNMSGKSTLLRTVGANAVLALAGAPVRALRLRLTPLTLGATLRLEDSLLKGRSRFFAEAMRIRQLLDLAGQRPPLLFLLDELFSGTNSADRRQGAEAVVRRLLDAGAIGFVTTHDLALTHLSDVLGSRAANVHFADQHADGTVTFDYRMRPGVLRSGNGLAILRALGINV